MPRRGFTVRSGRRVVANVDETWSSKRSDDLNERGDDTVRLRGEQGKSFGLWVKTAGGSLERSSPRARQLSPKTDVGRVIVAVTPRHRRVDAPTPAHFSQQPRGTVAQLATGRRHHLPRRGVATTGKPISILGLSPRPAARRHFCRRVSNPASAFRD